MLLPVDPADRAHVLRWLFCEQSEVIPAIASPRFRLATGGAAPDSPAAERRRAAGLVALGVLDGHLQDRSFLVGERYTIADIALYGYVHVAHEAGHVLADYSAVSAWIERVEATPGHVDDLVPIPPDTGSTRTLIC